MAAATIDRTELWIKPYALAGRAMLSLDDWLALRDELGLSPRDFQIVQCIFDDEKPEGIAERLGVSRTTVNTYLHRLYTKLEVSSRAQLILRVMDAHFVLRSRPARSY